MARFQSALHTSSLLLLGSLFFFLVRGADSNILTRALSWRVFLDVHPANTQWPLHLSLLGLRNAVLLSLSPECGWISMEVAVALSLGFVVNGVCGLDPASENPAF